MKIIDQRKTTQQFHELTRGVCFVYENDFYMKCDRCDYAVELGSGLLCEFDPLEEVTPIRATLVVE